MNKDYKDVKGRERKARLEDYYGRLGGEYHNTGTTRITALTGKHVVAHIDNYRKHYGSATIDIVERNATMINRMAASIRDSYYKNYKSINLIHDDIENVYPGNVDDFDGVHTIHKVRDLITQRLNQQKVLPGKKTMTMTVALRPTGTIETMDVLSDILEETLGAKCEFSTFSKSGVGKTAHLISSHKNIRSITVTTYGGRKCPMLSLLINYI